MKSNIFFLILLLIIIGILSCNTSSSLEFNRNKEEYIQAVDCLQKNYNSIFLLTSDKTSVDVYYSERTRNDICEGVLKLLKIHSVQIINYDKDSTAWFYSKPGKGIKSKQRILVFAKYRDRLNAKLTSDMKIISIKEDGWYELERVISLAN